jgi:Carboxypeptidase regulatory-like domain
MSRSKLKESSTLEEVERGDRLISEPPNNSAMVRSRRAAGWMGKKLRIRSSLSPRSIAVLLAIHLPLLLTAACQSVPPREVDSFGVQLAVNCGNRAAGYAGPFDAKELAGTVLSAGAPLDGASVVAQNKRTGEMLRTTTDGRGRFAFRNVGTATFEMFACKPGWSSMQFTVNVSPGSSSTGFTVDLPSERPHASDERH